MPKKSVLSQYSWRKLCDDVVEHLVELEYSIITIWAYRRIYREFLHHLEITKRSLFPVGPICPQDFMKTLGIPIKGDSHSLSKYQSQVQKAMRILLEFHDRGTFDLFQKKEIARSLPPPLSKIHDEYCVFLKDEKTASQATLRSSTYAVCRFLRFMVEKNIPSVKSIRTEDVHSFFKELIALSPISIASVSDHLNLFFRYLFARKIISIEVLNVVPHIRCAQRTCLADTWPKDTVNRFLSAIDTNTTIGKRDYAICLLVARLGLRVSDIRGLCLENIHWSRAVISGHL